MLLTAALIEQPIWTLTPADQTTKVEIELDEVKDFLHLPREDSAWDAELTAFVASAQKGVEHLCQMVLSPATYTGTFQAFHDKVRLNMRPFRSVSKVEYVDPSTGEITTVDAATYHWTPYLQKCGVLFLGEGLSWPTAARRHDAVRITVAAGFTVLPEEVKQAVLMTVAALDKNRGDASSGGNSSTTVYAMKSAAGRGSVVPQEARSLLTDYIFRVV